MLLWEFYLLLLLCNIHAEIHFVHFFMEVFKNKLLQMCYFMRLVSNHTHKLGNEGFEQQSHIVKINSHSTLGIGPRQARSRPPAEKSRTWLWQYGLAWHMGTFWKKKQNLSFIIIWNCSLCNKVRNISVNVWCNQSPVTTCYTKSPASGAAIMWLVSCRW